MVLGSSAASNFKGINQDDCWPTLLKNELSATVDFRFKVVSGLTFVRSIPELSKMPNTDLLLLHFGTAIGWPVSIVKKGTLYGINFTSEFGFHQPAFKSNTARNRIKSFWKARFRNLIKYLLFFLGLYKPRVNRKEIHDQIRAVVEVAKSKSQKIVWIQHQALTHRSIFLERQSYKRYYREIQESLKTYASPALVIIELPKSFLVQENYLLDSVHLSAKGHYNLYKIVEGVLGVS